MNNGNETLNGMGRFLEARFEWLLAQFVAEGSSFAAGIAMILILAAVLIVVWQLIFGVVPTWVALTLRCTAIRQALKGADTPEDHRELFAKAYADTIDPALSGQAPTKFGQRIGQVLRWTHVEHSLRQAWSELKETFVDESEPGVIKNTARPHGYILRAVANPARLGWLSGFFVSLGLFFTFVGIIAVLGVSASAIDTTANTPDSGSDFGAMQGAIIQIVSGASSKFYASVGGIMAAIILKFSSSVFSAVIKQRAERLADLLESGLAFIPEQRLIQLQLEQLTEQTVQLKKFNTDLAVSIGDRFDQAMAPVTASLGEIKESFEEQSQRTMQVLGEGVGDAINNIAGGEIRALGNVLAELKGELSGMSSKLSEGGDIAADQLKDAATQLRSVSEGFQEKFNGFAEQLNTFSTAQSERMTEALDQLAAASTDASRQINDGVEASVGKVAGTLEGGAEKLNAAAEQNAAIMGEMSGRLESLTAEIGVSARKQMDEALGAAAEESREAAKRASTLMTEAYEEASENWVEALSESLGRLEALKAGFDKAVSAVRTHSDAISKAADGTATSANALVSSARSLEGVAGPIADATSKLHGASSSVERAVSELTSQAKSSSELIETVAEEMNETSQAATEAWQAYQDRFDGVDDDLEKVLNQISAALDQNAARLTEYVTQVDGQLAKAVTNLSGVVQPLTTLADELEAAIGKIQSQSVGD